MGSVQSDHRRMVVPGRKLRNHYWSEEEWMLGGEKIPTSLHLSICPSMHTFCETSLEHTSYPLGEPAFSLLSGPGGCTCGEIAGLWLRRQPRIRPQIVTVQLPSGLRPE